MTGHVLDRMQLLFFFHQLAIQHSNFKFPWLAFDMLNFILSPRKAYTHFYTAWSEITVKPGIYSHQQKCQLLIMFTKHKCLKFGYATVGANLLIKEMLLRHSLLTKTGHEGFIIKCSTTILSSVKRVLKNQI